MSGQHTDTRQDTWYTLTEAARVIGVSTRTIQRRIDKGQYKSKKQGHSRLVLLPEHDKSHDIQTDIVATLKERIKHLEAELEEAKRQTRGKDEQLRAKDEYLQIEMRRKDEQIAEASHRHDTVVMQMTRLLEYHQQPFWRKLFSRKALPPPEQIMDMEPGDNKAKE